MTTNKPIINTPNILTFSRIVASFVMIAFEPFSLPFMTLYLFAAVTDMCDGFIARKTNSITIIGSKLDTLADFTFMVVCLFKFFKLLKLSLWMYLAIAIIAIIKFVNIAITYIKTQGFIVDVHSAMNKVTGMILFFIPISYQFGLSRFFIICGIGTALIASIDELIQTIKLKKSQDLGKPICF